MVVPPSLPPSSLPPFLPSLPPSLPLSLTSLLPPFLPSLSSLLPSTLSYSYVVEPYHKYPNLLDVLFFFLKTEQTTGIRREVIRVLGLLGALDPYKHKQHRRSGQRSKMGTPISKPMDKKSRQQQNTSELAVWTNSAMGDYYSNQAGLACTSNWYDQYL